MVQTEKPSYTKTWRQLMAWQWTGLDAICFGLTQVCCIIEFQEEIIF